MYSVLDSIIAALKAHTFSIADVQVNPPYFEGTNTYPLIVVHEINNKPTPRQQTVDGETRSSASYQIDVYAKACRDTNNDILSAYDAAMVIAGEADIVMRDLSIFRSSFMPIDSAMTDIARVVWRGNCVIDSYGYIYQN